MLCTSMLGIYEKSGQWQKARALFTAMQRDGVAMDSMVYTNLVGALAKGKP